MKLQSALSLSALLCRSETPETDVRWLLSKVLDRPVSTITSWLDYDLSDAEVNQFSSMLLRRIRGEPVAYIRGDQGFWTLELEVDQSTLIPRPDTECLVAQALELPLDEKRPCRVLDLGTGTGAIALSIATERPNWNVIGRDISADAVNLASRNAIANDIKNTCFVHGNWFDGITQSFELIVSNPPYIAEGDPHLSRGDVAFEPRSALESGPDGLRDVRLIVSQSSRYLCEGGWLVIEHGYDQGLAIRVLFEHEGFSLVKTVKDYGGQDRVTLGCMREKVH